jgi:TonB family protein
MRHGIHGLALFLVLSVCCRADLTLRYTVDVQTSTAASPALGKALAIRIKDDKTLSNLGALTALIDNSTSAITLLNPATKQYATSPTAEFTGGLQPKIPPASAALINTLKFDVETTSTGQFGIIAGMRAEEHLTTLSASMAAPGGPESPLVRLEMHTWLASPDDLNRIPALRQYALSAQRALNVSAAGNALDRLFRQVPGMSEKVRVLAEEGARNAGSLTLKLQEKLYIVKGDPNAQIFAMTIELADVSSDAIDDSVFAVPQDFQLVSAAEIMKVLTPASAATPMPANLAPRGSVTAPSVIYKRNPGYTEEARRAKLSGSVTLKLVVDKEGMPEDIQVVQSLGMGLDEKAIEAVRQWRFRPGQKDGKPVNEIVRVQVNFKLLADPPQQ